MSDTSNQTLYIILGKDKNGNNFIPMGVHPTVDLPALTRMRYLLELQYGKKGNTYEIKKLSGVNSAGELGYRNYTI